MQAGQREPLRVDVHLARLDLGQVEDVVDQPQQVRAGRVNDGRVLHLLDGEVAVRVLREQPGEHQQAVQRGAQLVRHVGEELRLVPRRLVKLLGALLDLLPGLLDLRVLGLDVPVLRGEQRRLVGQLGVGPLQLLLPRLQLGGQPLRLLEQRVGAGVGDHRVHVDADGLHRAARGSRGGPG